jgi:hypothetical protein
MYSADGKLYLVYQRTNPLADVSVVIHYPKNGRQYFPAGGSERSPAVTWHQFVYP